MTTATKQSWRAHLLHLISATDHPLRVPLDSSGEVRAAHLLGRGDEAVIEVDWDHTQAQQWADTTTSLRQGGGLTAWLYLSETEKALKMAAEMREACAPT